MFGNSTRSTWRPNVQGSTRDHRSADARDGNRFAFERSSDHTADWTELLEPSFSYLNLADANSRWESTSRRMTNSPQLSLSHRIPPRNLGDD